MMLPVGFQVEPALSWTGFPTSYSVHLSHSTVDVKTCACQCYARLMSVKSLLNLFYCIYTNLQKQKGVRGGGCVFFFFIKDEKNT